MFIHAREQPSQVVGLELRGRMVAKRGDQFVLYLAPRCVKTVAAARRRTVLAYAAHARVGRDRFRSTLAAELVRPGEGVACAMVADRKGRKLVQASARYRLT